MSMTIALQHPWLAGCGPIQDHLSLTDSIVDSITPLESSPSLNGLIIVGSKRESRLAGLNVLPVDETWTIISGPRDDDNLSESKFLHKKSNRDNAAKGIEPARHGVRNSGEKEAQSQPGRH